MGRPVQAAATAWLARTRRRRRSAEHRRDDRAYLYRFEQALRDTGHDVMLPWWPALKLLCADESADRSHLQVTVLPLVVGRDGPELGDALFFSSMRFLTFD